MSDLVDTMIEELKLRDIVDITDVESLEDEYFVPLGHILAWRAAPEFGAASDPALAALATQAERFLTKMAADRYQGGTVECDYF